MNIVRRLSDGLVQYITTEPYELTNKYYKSDGIKAMDIKDTTHEVLKNITLPSDFYRGVYTYNNGIWVIINQSLLDNIIEEEKNIRVTEIEERHETLGKKEYKILRDKIQNARYRGVISSPEFKQLRRFVKPI
ncbi:hypothetical protein LCGC14_2515550, partial [marine sediment metagenome]